MRVKAAAAAIAAVCALAAAAKAAEPERLKVTGEIIDTWCYFSGVMGGPDAVVGSAHHTCALWCAAGGIPVGLLGEDGTVYMVLKLDGADSVVGGDTILDLQSDAVTADGLHYQRDGLDYIVVSQVLSNEGIVNETHEDYGPVPPFAIPDPTEQ